MVPRKVWADTPAASSRQAVNSLSFMREVRIILAAVRYDRRTGMYLPSSVDVFVVGGGPAGLAAAIAARRRGLTVTVADSVRPPIDKACGEGIMPDGVAAARELGIALDGVPFRGIRFHDGGSTAEAPFPDGEGLAMRR